MKKIVIVISVFVFLLSFMVVKKPEFKKPFYNNSRIDTLRFENQQQIITYNENGLIETVSTVNENYSMIKDTIGFTSTKVFFNKNGFCDGVSIQNGYKVTPYEGNTKSSSVDIQKSFVYFDSLGNVSKCLFRSDFKKVWEKK